MYILRHCKSYTSSVYLARVTFKQTSRLILCKVLIVNFKPDYRKKYNSKSMTHHKQAKRQNRASPSLKCDNNNEKNVVLHVSSLYCLNVFSIAHFEGSITSGFVQVPLPPDMPGPSQHIFHQPQKQVRARVKW